MRFVADHNRLGPLLRGRVLRDSKRRPLPHSELPVVTSSYANERRVLQAAALLEHARGWWCDENFLRSGGKIHYAVDSDVVYLHSSPADVLRYVDIFDQGTDESVWLLANQLTQFIFYRRNPDASTPLLIIPPQDIEIHRMGARLTRDVHAEVTRAVEQASALVQELEVLGRLEERQLVEFLFEKAPSLLQIIDESGPMVEVDRLSRLLEERLVQLRQ